ARASPTEALRRRAGPPARSRRHLSERPAPDAPGVPVNAMPAYPIALDRCAAHPRAQRRGNPTGPGRNASEWESGATKKVFANETGMDPVARFGVATAHRGPAVPGHHGLPGSTQPIRTRAARGSRGGTAPAGNRALGRLAVRGGDGTGAVRTDLDPP